AARRATCRSLRASHLAGLPGLAQDLLAGVADALALVRLRLAPLADVGGHLADELLVRPAHRQPRGCLDDELDPCRWHHLDRMRVAERQDELLALQLRTVADA